MRRLFFMLVLILAVVVSAAWNGEARADAQIEAIQQSLSDLGYDPGPVDGAWGQRTEAAARRFLKDRNLNAGAVFSPEGRDGAMLLWLMTGPLETGPARARLTPQAGHSAKVMDVAYSPDGRHIVTASIDHSLKLWERESGHLVRTIRGHTNNVLAVEYSPDGTSILSGGVDEVVRLWDAKSGRQIRVFSESSQAVYDVAYSPDGHSIASCGADGILEIWKLRDGQLLHGVVAHADSCYSVSFSPDGTKIVTGGIDASMRIWNVSSGELIATLRRDYQSVLSAKFSFDGSRIVAGKSDGTIEIWNARLPSILHVLKGHIDVAFSVSFSPDDRYIASASYDSKRWTPFMRQLGGFAKVDWGFVYAASFSLIDCIMYASPGVAPSRAECGRSAL